MSMLPADESPARAEVSKWNAERMASSSTENMLCRSKPFFTSSWSSSNDLPVNTSVSGSASCCCTIWEPAARAMSSEVRPCV